MNSLPLISCTMGANWRKTLGNQKKELHFIRGQTRKQNNSNICLVGRAAHPDRGYASSEDGWLFFWPKKGRTEMEIYTVGETVKVLGIPRHRLSYAIEVGRVLEPRKTALGRHRFYTSEDLNTLREILTGNEEAKE